MNAYLAIGLALLTQTGIMSAQTTPSAAFQIGSATRALPEKLRAGARVMAYDASGKLIALRRGTNEMVCLADNARSKPFHVACYHRSLEPFMARGRELQALGKSKEYVDSVRFADLRRGRYRMPPRPAALYQYFASRDSVDTTTGVISGAQYLYVVYTPHATYSTTGISEAPAEGAPWLMYPGKPWAHIMIQPRTRERIVVAPR